jgi:ribosomal protein L37E
MLVSQKLLSINIVELFSYDAIQNKTDVVGEYLSSLMAETSKVGKGAAQKAGASWTGKNANEPVFLCLSCGSRAVTRDRGVCIGCGVEGDEEIVTLLHEFEKAETALAELQRAKPYGLPA